jgi:hypothetical protein
LTSYASTMATDPARARHLLPHERRFADWMLRRQQTHRTASVAKMEANYGEDGMVLLGAALSSAFPASVVACGGIVLLFLSRDERALGPAAYTFMVLGAGAVLLSMIRTFQAARAGRLFRGDRPFLR